MDGACPTLTGAKRGSKSLTMAATHVKSCFQEELDKIDVLRSNRLDKIAECESAHRRKIVVSKKVALLNALGKEEGLLWKDLKFQEFDIEGEIEILYNWIEYLDKKINLAVLALEEKETILNDSDESTKDSPFWRIFNERSNFPTDLCRNEDREPDHVDSTEVDLDSMELTMESENEIALNDDASSTDVFAPFDGPVEDTINVKGTNGVDYHSDDDAEHENVSNSNAASQSADMIFDAPHGTLSSSSQLLYGVVEQKTHGNHENKRRSVVVHGLPLRKKKRKRRNFSHVTREPPIQYDGIGFSTEVKPPDDIKTTCASESASTPRIRQNGASELHPQSVDNAFVFSGDVVGAESSIDVGCRLTTGGEMVEIPSMESSLWTLSFCGESAVGVGECDFSGCNKSPDDSLLDADEELAAKGTISSRRSASCSRNPLNLVEIISLCDYEADDGSDDDKPPRSKERKPLFEVTGDVSTPDSNQLAPAESAVAKVATHHLHLICAHVHDDSDDSDEKMKYWIAEPWQLNENENGYYDEAEANLAVETASRMEDVAETFSPAREACTAGREMTPALIMEPLSSSKTMATGTRIECGPPYDDKRMLSYSDARCDVNLTLPVLCTCDKNAEVRETLMMTVGGKVDKEPPISLMMKTEVKEKVLTTLLLDDDDEQYGLQHLRHPEASGKSHGNSPFPQQWLNEQAGKGMMTYDKKLAKHEAESPMKIQFEVCVRVGIGTALPSQCGCTSMNGLHKTWKRKEKAARVKMKTQEEFG
ncbi:unnamed protein product [Orchesella dallaii]|uniref:Uncharacterized protein n=1 Tax=Orchesella dallaii TaxID=48710 RepID=A0ABP1QYM9_9HEXA